MTVSAEQTGSRVSSSLNLRESLRGIFSFPVFVGAMVGLAAALVTTLWDPGPVIAGRVVVEGDTWWHLVVGERILSTHTWPQVDLYSFTMHGAPWIAYEWLGEVVMAAAARLGGLRGLAVLLLLLAVTFSVLTYYYAWLRSHNVLASGIAAIAVLQVTSPVVGMRPQMLGYAFLVLTFICLERFAQGRPKALWPLPLVFLVWVNSHGSFVLGFFAIGVYFGCGLVEFRLGHLEAKRWAPTQRIQLLWISLLSVLAAVIAPYGARLFVYPIEMLTEQHLNMLASSEWQPIQFSYYFAQAFLALLLIILLLQVVAPVTWRVETLVLLLFSIGETCIHARFVVFFAVVAAPVLSVFLACWLPSYRRDGDHPVANALLTGLVAVGIVAFFPSASKLQEMMDRSYPAGAVRFIRQHPGVGNIFNREELGGYLMWAMPERKVFIDGRNDFYEYGGVLWDYYNFITFQGRPEKFLGKYNLDAALLKSDDDLREIFEALPAWTQAYCDSNSVVFVRTDIFRKMPGAESPTRCQ